jgi:acetate kinase
MTETILVLNADVIPTDEEQMIARHTLRMLRAHSSSRLKEKRA